MAARSSPPEETPQPQPPSLKVQRLKHRPDFLRCARGTRRVSPGVTVEAAATPTKFADPAGVRVGFTATKKTIGGAVERNRAKRRLRAAAAALLPLYGVAGSDYVLVARAGTLRRPFADLLEDLTVSLKGARQTLVRTEEPLRS